MPAVGTSNAPQTVKHAPAAVAPPKPSIGNVASSIGSSVSHAVAPVTSTATAAAATTHAAASAVAAAASTHHAVQAITHPTPILASIQSVLPNLTPSEMIFAPAAIKAGARYNVSPALLMGVIKQETGFDPTYKGPDTTDGNARGSTGFVPKSAEQHGVKYGASPEAIQSQVAGAAKYLAELDVNNHPQQAIKHFGMGRDPAPVEQAARSYGPLDRLAVKAAAKYSADPNHATAPEIGNIAGVVGDVTKKVGQPMATPQSSIAAAAKAVGSGIQNPQRPMPQQTAGDQAAQTTGNPPTKQIVKHLVKAVAKSGGPLDQAYGRNSSDTLSMQQIAQVAEAAGLPGVTFSQVAIGESGQRPGADGGLSGTPGPAGYGLFQMTPAVQSQETLAKWAAIAGPGKTAADMAGPDPSYFNPVKNAQMAKVLYDSGGIGNWYGVGSVTDPNAHYTGPSLSDKSISQELVARAHGALGKEATKAILAGGKIVQAPKQGGDDGIAVPHLLKFVVNTEGDAAQAQELGVKDGTLSIRGLVPPMQVALVKLAKLSGEPVQVNEGFRTAQRQIDLANGAGGATGPAAAPGTSNHEFGLAADLQLTAKQTSLLGQAGLNNTAVGGEPWHVELNSPPTRPAAPPDPSDLGAAPQGVPIKGTNLMVVQPAAPAATTTGTAVAATGTTAAAPGTTPVTGTAAPAEQKAARQAAKGSQMMANTVGLTALPFAAHAYIPTTGDPRDLTGDPLARAFSRFRPNA